MSRIVQGDVFESDFRDATWLVTYLLPELNLRLTAQAAEDWKPGRGSFQTGHFRWGTWKLEQDVKCQWTDGLFLHHSRTR